MSNITIVQAREHFSDVINLAVYAKERVTLSRHGKKVAAVIPLEDLDLLERLEDSRDIAAALAAEKEMHKKGGIDWETFKREEF